MYLKRCERCKRVYKPTGYHQMYCPDCRPIYKPKSRDKKCDVCGAAFTDNSMNNNQKYCSARCRKFAHNEQAANWRYKKYADRLWAEMV